MAVKTRCKRRDRTFWRCGVEHTPEEQEFPPDRFTAEELERLQAEPMIDVEIEPDVPVLSSTISTHAQLDEFAEAHQDEYPQLAEVIGRGANDGFNVKGKRDFITAVLAGEYPQFPKKAEAKKKPGAKTKAQAKKKPGAKTKAQAKSDATPSDAAGGKEPDESGQAKDATTKEPQSPSGGADGD